jgi:hypothetical protein
MVKLPSSWARGFSIGDEKKGTRRIMVDTSRWNMQRLYVSPETLMKYLLGVDDKIDTMITCKDPGCDLITSDQALYEALGSMDKDKVNYFRLVKLLESVRVVSFEEKLGQKRSILTDERVAQIRSNADVILSDDACSADATIPTDGEDIPEDVPDLHDEPEEMNDTTDKVNDDGPDRT